VEILQELKEWFQIELVLADSLWRKWRCDSRIATLKIPFIVAIRGNHGVLIAPGQKCYNRAAGIYQVLSHHPPETRYIRALSLAKFVHFVTTRISKTNSPTTNPLDPWFIMTNLPKSWQN